MRPAALGALVCAGGVALACGGPPVVDGVVRADPFHVIAHRGASDQAPENTLPAFERALELGAEHVELDVQLSRDDVLILFHDRTLDAKTPLRGRVRDFSAAELRGADIGSWFDAKDRKRGERFAGTPLIGLEELFDAFGPRPYYHVEIKAPEESIPRLLLDAIAAHDLGERVTLTSFSREQLARVRALDAGIRTCLLIERIARLEAAARARGERELTSLGLQWSAIDAAAELALNQVGVNSRELRSEVVARARERGLSIRAWGVKSEADARRVIALGADGMTVDWPDRAFELLR